MRQVLGAGALGRPRGIGSRGRWEGGPGWGTHVTPWLIHVNVWQKPLQYCKVISLQLIKINEKKKKKRILQCRWPRFNSWAKKIPFRRDRLSTSIFLRFPDGSAGKESICKAEDLGSIPGLGSPLEKGKATHSSILDQRILGGKELDRS